MIDTVTPDPRKKGQLTQTGVGWNIGRRSL
jgi:hypothetical protein